MDKNIAIFWTLFRMDFGMYRFLVWTLTIRIEKNSQELKTSSQNVLQEMDRFLSGFVFKQEHFSDQSSRKTHIVRGGEVLRDILQVISSLAKRTQSETRRLAER